MEIIYIKVLVTKGLFKIHTCQVAVIDFPNQAHEVEHQPYPWLVRLRVTYIYTREGRLPR